MAAGMPLLAALEAARQAAGAVAIGERRIRAQERVTGGEQLSRALAYEEAVIPLAVQLYAVGEGSGRLAPMATAAGEMAEAEALRSLQTAIDLIGPVLVIGMGGLIAFVAAALLQAVYTLRPGA
jgi:type II secretory pathway component PulF